MSKKTITTCHDLTDLPTQYLPGGNEEKQKTANGMVEDGTLQK